jgi:hypothetical protein
LRQRILYLSELKVTLTRQNNPHGNPIPKPHPNPNPQTQAQQEKAIALMVAQTDDPWLITLEKEYVGQYCFLHDISLRHKLYRICRISYWPSSATRYSSWEATMEPIHVHDDGSVYMIDADVVRCSNGKKLTKAKSLLGYILAEYIEGDDAEPTRSDCVERYIMNALQKHHAFNLKIRPTSTVD